MGKTYFHISSPENGVISNATHIISLKRYITLYRKNIQYIFVCEGVGRAQHPQEEHFKHNTKKMKTSSANNLYEYVRSKTPATTSTTSTRKKKAIVCVAFNIIHLRLTCLFRNQIRTYGIAARCQPPCCFNE